MSDIKNGGPAFPVYDDTHMYPTSTGMTLRDWFAGQALANDYTKSQSAHDVAMWAYQLADAMIAARKKGDEE